MNLFESGDFTLNSGAKSKWKLECDALTDSDIETLAQMVRQMVGHFSDVVGVPRGGLRLAAALWPFVGISGPTLVVDDVLTTGRSMLQMIDEEYKDTPTIGVVIFARGQCPLGIKAVFQMPEVFWTKPRHS